MSRAIHVAQEDQGATKRINRRSLASFEGVAPDSTEESIEPPRPTKGKVSMTFEKPTHVCHGSETFKHPVDVTTRTRDTHQPSSKYWVHSLTKISLPLQLVSEINLTSRRLLRHDREEIIRALRTPHSYKGPLPG
jgi:hypothetical protein